MRDTPPARGPARRPDTSSEYDSSEFGNSNQPTRDARAGRGPLEAVPNRGVLLRPKPLEPLVPRSETAGKRTPELRQTHASSSIPRDSLPASMRRPPYNVRAIRAQSLGGRLEFPGNLWARSLFLWARQPLVVTSSGPSTWTRSDADF